MVSHDYSDELFNMADKKQVKLFLFAFMCFIPVIRLIVADKDNEKKFASEEYHSMPQIYMIRRLWLHYDAWAAWAHWWYVTFTLHILR